jgi:hypothetical protein
VSRWCDHFAITPQEARRFLRAAEQGDGPVHDLIEQLMEEQRNQPLHVEMDKAWEPIHRCLTDDTDGGDLDFEASPYPLALCILGDQQLLKEGHRTAALLTPEQVADVAAALAKITEHWLRARFFALPDNQFHEIDEDNFGWTWAYFQDLPPLFVRALALGRAVLCTISH